MKISISTSFCPAALAASFLLAGCSKTTGLPQDAAGQLVISQMLVHSASDSLEWIDLRNDGEGPAKLAGIKIAAVSYQFPSSSGTLAPKAHIVLTNDPNLFRTRYPGIQVYGTYSGRLSDQGEEVQLDGSEGKDFKLTYADREPWPVAATTVGASLVYKGGNPEAPTSWAASSTLGGTPGKDAATAVDKEIWISEVRPADSNGEGFVELASNAGVAIDLSGWVLAPSTASSESDTLPPGTSIAAHGRIVLRQTAAAGQIGWGHLLPSPSGGELLLIERGASGQATGNVHFFAWSVVPQGMSTARIGPTGTENGIGLVASPTPGGSDGARKIGLATITEICYNPSSGGAEFLEIQNETDSTIHLGFPGDTARSWSLSGTGKTFLATDTLAPKGFMVLVSKDDITAETFRTKWNIPDNVPVLTYSGRLDNSGEKVELRWPTVPTANGTGGIVWKHLVEDEATWLPDAPWPKSANGGGACLERVSRALPGTSAEAWIAASPTPGK